MNPTTPAAPVIVVIDGSPSSLAALRQAADLAATMDTSLEVITCWSVPQFYAEDIELDGAAFERDARSRQDFAVSDALGDHRPARMQTSLRRGRTATELDDASASARLLVLGTRGHSEFVHLLLGSVSLECSPRALSGADRPRPHTASAQ